eukprot:8195418-Pyramimonas_sp.AAC.1
MIAVCFAGTERTNCVAACRARLEVMSVGRRQVAVVRIENHAAIYFRAVGGRQHRDASCRDHGDA